MFLPISLALIALLEGGEVFLLMLSAALVHELGHYFFIKLCGARITRVDIEVLGALIVYADGHTALNEDIAISFGGIIFNIAAAVIGIGCFTFIYELHLLIFIAANLALALVNLLPASSLDGGKALSAILLKKYEIDKAERIGKRVSIIAKGMLIVFSVGLIVLSGFNIALIILFLLNIIQISN